MKAVLELKNVSKVMGNTALVEDISFTVNKGEIFGFLGPNGAGKTTTIKMITGLYSISKGEIYIDGKNVKKQFEKALQGVGGIIENPEMYGYLSGKDNLKIYARMHGGITKQRIDEVVNLVKLGNRINDKVSKYSLGMRQRLGVAQALLHKPKLLILDEPTNGLDPMGIKELRETLRELCDKEGLSVMVSSHLLSEMELMCDRFGIIDGGKIIDIKTIDDIKKNESVNIKTYFLEVDDKKKAIRIINSRYPNVALNEDKEGIKISCEKDELAKINKDLVINDISVFGTRVIIKTLEEEFMEVTNGSKDQIR
ncbi:ABC transporter ATP-binding protein [Clostridium botulinum]|uniref:ABC transporter ATP-binding protein n=1 Tax=Clostridium botulinum TaxID=1491 RepID=A0A6B4JPC5_CLOBO|nr:ABC transporter ATP-binding protein [Clostridium botulinum]EES50177.1 bacitracin transport ATP-binding protein BcrA [Clostridium botulinum E1 str. 'BoNT E Beluga']MBY6761987.1 ABC transporter ATP-binding protein [Clostridium botulinum]MBY6920913.1 ABC transporter ATP-binding protein [Clostridium botulinum]MCR1131335.1 ABC transporter ATP-binding protein [Clostridium botulinum]NFH70140.1 ABC transporter ATP-binding protein [Clostridium botulinum]